jgi:hypothetical protein
MTKRKIQRRNGGHDDATHRVHKAKGTPASLSVPRDGARKPATPLELVSRALDQELEWWFSYAEMAMHRQSVAMLPSYAAVRVLAEAATDDACRAKALELGRRVRVCLASLREPHASVLRAAYTPRRWPLAVQHEFKCLAGIAVRLTLTDDLWPARTARSGLEEAAATRLAAAITGKTSKVSLPRIKSAASRLLGGAIVAYTTARSLEGAPIGIA